MTMVQTGGGTSGCLVVIVRISLISAFGSSNSDLTYSTIIYYIISCIINLFALVLMNQFYSSELNIKFMNFDLQK